MFIPFISSRRNTQRTSRYLYRREGVGGHGSGGHSSGGESSSGRDGSSGSSSSVIDPSKARSGSIQSSGSSVSGGSNGKEYKTSTYTDDPPIPLFVIPSGQTFAGRLIGGGSRSSIFGTRTYGSGYPGIATRGTSGRGFPFVFWPITWGLAFVAGSSGLSGSDSNSTSASYLNTTIEYGNSTNTTRPGGPLTVATFTSLSGSPSTFYVLSDNTTITSLITDLSSNCTSFLTTPSSNLSSPYLNTPQPEQVIQYYRASSIALALEGYNNSATYSSDSFAPDSPLPSTVDVNLVQCLNQTIGVAAPIPDGTISSRFGLSNLNFIGLMGLLWLILS